MEINLFNEKKTKLLFKIKAEELPRSLDPRGLDPDAEQNEQPNSQKSEKRNHQKIKIGKISIDLARNSAGEIEYKFDIRDYQGPKNNCAEKSVKFSMFSGKIDSIAITSPNVSKELAICREISMESKKMEKSILQKKLSPLIKENLLLGKRNVMDCSNSEHFNKAPNLKKIESLSGQLENTGE